MMTNERSQQFLDVVAGSDDLFDYGAERSRLLMHVGSGVSADLLAAVYVLTATDAYGGRLSYVVTRMASPARRRNL